MNMIGVLIQVRNRAIVLSGVEHDKVEEFAKRERGRQMHRLSSVAVGVVADFMVVSNYAHVRIYATFRIQTQRIGDPWDLLMRSE
jgi:hypothetical protein